MPVLTSTTRSCRPRRERQRFARGSTSRPTMGRTESRRAPNRPVHFGKGSRNTSVYYATELLYHESVTSQEFKRWLQKQGATFESGHGGHLIVRISSKMSVLRKTLA